MNLNKIEPAIVERFETATFFYNADTNTIGFSHWRVGDETNPDDFAIHRAVLTFLPAPVDEHEAMGPKARPRRRPSASP